MTKKKTIKFRSSMYYELTPRDCETITGDSLTVPGETYTINELYERTKGGILVETLVNVRQPNYTDTDDFEDVDPFKDPNLDLTDVKDIIEESQNTIEDAQQKLEEAKSKASEKADTTKKRSDEKTSAEPEAQKKATSENSIEDE